MPERVYGKHLPPKFFLVTTAIGDDAQTLQSAEPTDWGETVRGSEVASSDVLKKRFEVKIKI